MIVKTIDLSGRVKYFGAATGKEVKLQREVGRYQRKIPDDVMRFLQPKITDMINSQINKSDDPVKNLKNKSIYDSNGNKKYPSLFSRIWQWLKSILNGSK